jgi:two-component system, cell cycle response regulator
VGEKPFSLLLVDDTRSTAARLVQALGSQDYAPRVVPSGPHVSGLALEVDLVLLCLEPDDGLTLLRRLMDVEGPGMGAPVIVIAPAEARALRLATLRLGVEVVSDPWDTEELRARMLRAFSARQVLVTLASQVSELQKLSVLDGLTQVHNRHYFQERLREEFRAAQRYDDTLSLILVDLDHFKEINDTWGHLAGDDVLRKVAKVLQRSVRETDAVARYGGEEFAVLLPRTPLTGALTVAERIWKELGALQAGPDGNLRVTASLGVSSFPHRNVLSPEQLLLTADEALYRAKHEGRNRICLHPALPPPPGAPRG